MDTAVSRRLAAIGPAVLRLEPPIVLLLAPLAWWPNLVTPFAFAIVPALWLLRWRVSGRLTVRTVFDLPAIVLLLSLPLAIFVLNGPAPARPLGFVPQVTSLVADRPPVVRRGQPIAPQAYDYHDANQGTLSLWVKPLGWAGADGGMHDIVGNDEQRWLVYKGPANRLYFYEPGGGDVLAGPVNGVNFAADTWHHIVAVWDADESIDGSGYAALYLDGKAIDRRATRFAPMGWGNLVVGNTRDGSNPGQVEVEDLGHWDRPLGVDDVRQLYSAGRGWGAEQFADASLKFLQLPQAAPGNGDVLVFPRRRASLVADGLMEQSGTVAFELVGRPATVAKSATRVFGDRQALHVATAGTEPGGVQQTLALTAGKDYALSAWVYAEQGAARIGVATEDSGGTARTAGPAASWQPVEIAVRAGGANVLRLVGEDGGPVDFYVDNVSLVPSSVSNGGMEGDYESGVAPDWRTGGGAAGLEESARVHGGAKAQRVRFSACEGQRLSQTVTGLQVGSWYALSSWLASAPGMTGLAIDVDTTPPTARTFGIESSGWTRRSLVFQATAASQTVSLRPSCVGGSLGERSVLVDDVAIVRLEPLSATWAEDLWDRPGHGHGGEARRIWSLLLGLALLYAVANAATADVRRLYLPALFVGAVLVAGVALLATEWYQGDKPFQMVGIQTGLPRLPLRLVEGTREGGLGPNEVGGVLGALLPITLGAALGWRGAGRWPLVVGAAVEAAALALVQSRSALLGAAVGIGLLMVWRWRRVSLAALALVALAAIGTVLTTSTGLALPWPLVGRAELMGQAWRILEDHLVTGIGIGRFDLAYAAYFASPIAPEPFEVHAHNLVLQAWLDLGMVGGLAYLGLFAAALVACWRAGGRGASGESWPARALAAGVVAMLVFGLADTVAPGARGGVFFWAVFGLAAALDRRPDRGYNGRAIDKGRSQG